MSGNKIDYLIQFDKLEKIFCSNICTMHSLLSNIVCCRNKHLSINCGTVSTVCTLERTEMQVTCIRRIQLPAQNYPSSSGCQGTTTIEYLCSSFERSRKFNQNLINLHRFDRNCFIHFNDIISHPTRIRYREPLLSGMLLN